MKDNWVLFIGFALVVGPAIICGMKGKWWFGVLGLFLTPIFSWVGMCRLAKPGSYWDSKYYGHHKMQRSWERFEKKSFEKAQASS
jgi:hypothetical protein